MAGDCDTCKRVFVQVARLMQRLKAEEISVEARELVRETSHLVQLTGYHIIDQELRHGKNAERAVS